MLLFCLLCMYVHGETHTCRVSTIIKIGMDGAVDVSLITITMAWPFKVLVGIAHLQPSVVWSFLL